VRRIYWLLISGFVNTALLAQQQITISEPISKARDIPETPAGTVEGHVSTIDRKPAAGVNVELKGTERTTTTDDNGRFILKNIKEGTYILQVSMVGLQTQEKTIEVSKDKSYFIEFVLAEDAKQLSQVIVTAQKSLNEKVSSIGKLPVQPKDLPQATMVIDKSILERQQVQSMSDVLQNANGVYIMGNTGGYQEEIAARGYSFSSSNTFKNGARFNNGIKAEFSSVEKIEIVKGGNAILYGNVGAGGILNIVTKKPKFEQGGEISFRTGSFNLYKPIFDIYGPLNKSQHIAYRVNGTYEKAGSFRDDVKSERFYINPSLLFKAGRKTELLIEGDYLKDERTPDFGIGAINYVIADVPRSRTLNVPWAYLRTTQYTTTATATHKVNEHIQVKATASHQRFNNEMFSASRPASTAIAANGTWARGLQKTKTNEGYYFGAIDFTAKAKTGFIHHTILAGADADQYSTDAYTFINTRYNNSLSRTSLHNRNIYDTINIFGTASHTVRNDIPFLPDSLITTSPIVRHGFYIQDLMSVTDKLKILAGVRYSFQKNKDVSIYNVVKGSTSTNAGTRNEAFSPRVGVVFQPLKTTSLFTSYTNTFTLNTGVNIHNEALAPSIIDQFEAGIKNDFFNGALSVNITGYRIVNSNLAQTALFLADGTTPNTNSNIKELTGETTSKGVEVDIMSKPLSGFSLIAGYSYNDMRYTKVNGNTVNGNKLGDRLRYNPAHTANLNVHYTFKRESRLKGFYASAGMFYTGDRLAGRNPTNSPTNTNKLIELPDFITVDLNAGYALDPFAVRLKLSNLFNKLSYNAHDDNSINPIAPRQIAATFSYKF